MKTIFSETSNLASKMEGKDKYIDFDRKFIELGFFGGFLQFFSLHFFRFSRIGQFLLLIEKSYVQHVIIKSYFMMEIHFPSMGENCFEL